VYDVVCKNVRCAGQSYDVVYDVTYDIVC
jgi:hypothetical protein